jgi:hypothetical protein
VSDFCSLRGSRYPTSIWDGINDRPTALAIHANHLSLAATRVVRFTTQAAINRADGDPPKQGSTGKCGQQGQRAERAFGGVTPIVHGTHG